MAHNYQTRQDDGSWCWVTKHKVALFFEQVIIGSLVTKINAIAPIPQVLRTSNLAGFWFMTWDQNSKNHITLSKNFFTFMNFFPHLKNVSNLK